jgi:hypothetical protein
MGRSIPMWRKSIRDIMLLSLHEPVSDRPGLTTLTILCILKTDDSDDFEEPQHYYLYSEDSGDSEVPEDQDGYEDSEEE